MKDWGALADEKSIKKAAAALEANGIQVIVVEDGKSAKEKVLELLPKGAEVMNFTSVTLDTIGVAKEILESGNYNSVRAKLMSMDRATQGLEMQKLGAAPEWVVGSVQAVTEEGQLIFASNTGSQLGAYAYGSHHIIWVVGTQKIVKNLDEAMERIYDYILQLESERIRRVLGAAGSNVSKVLIINKEVRPGRLTLVLVKEKLGF